MAAEDCEGFGGKLGQMSQNVYYEMLLAEADLGQTSSGTMMLVAAGYLSSSFDSANMSASPWGSTSKRCSWRLCDVATPCLDELLRARDLVRFLA
ncbi:unnamed protein product [Hydatigera taeniaeformis]|uniref:Uncharacterized protein n=1 Tax=Hydatigena taeniaeformis TaxID=6205 RepID=A0A0R3WVU3_HYDTA|nr:unnamed protein product [Hydatigera taeniaeformis]